MVRHVPNLLSLSRLGLGVALYLVLRLETPLATVACVAIMLLSMLTDYLDGKLARRMQTVSLLGKWIDPLSDFSFFLIVYLAFFRLKLMPLALLLLFLARELTMYAVVRPLAAVHGLDPAAKLPGKLKTVAQNVGCLAIMAGIFAQQMGWLGQQSLRHVSLPLLCLLVAVSWASTYWYIRPLLRPAEAGGTDSAPTGSGEKPAARQVVRLIVVSVYACYLGQAVYFGLVCLLYRLADVRFLLFLGVSAAYHLLFALGLFLVRREFTRERDDAMLTRINPPLVLSFLRFSSIPTAAFLFVSREQIVVPLTLAPFLAFIFLTDLFDGLLARRLKMTTHIGRILDASGDYVLIATLSVLYVSGGLIPLWFFALALVRLLVQAVGIIALYFLRGYSVLRLSFLGKASVFALFVLYGFEIFELMGTPALGWSPLVDALELATAGILAASLAEKLWFLAKGYAAHLRRSGRGE